MVDLKPFCRAGKSGKIDLSSPFSFGAYTYASNGHIAIRVPREVEDGERHDAPRSIVTVFAPVDTACWLPLKLPVDALKHDRPMCMNCRGRGFGVRCDSCSGEGTHGCNCTKCSEPCEDCAGDGFVFAFGDPTPELRVECHHCDGGGFKPDTRVVLLPPDLALSAEYLRRMLELPGPVAMAMQSNTTNSWGEQEHPAQLFRFHGGYAVILPRRFRPDRDTAEITVTREQWSGVAPAAVAEVA